MGFSKEYLHVPDWTPKQDGSGYQEGAIVKHGGNIFVAKFWAGGAPGEDPGWALHDELYDVSAPPGGRTETAKVITYIPTWRGADDLNLLNGEIYKNMTHGILSFLMLSERHLGEFETTSLEAIERFVQNVVSIGHANDTRIMVALGGASDFGFLQFMEEVGKHLSVSENGYSFSDAAAERLLDGLVARVVDFVQSRGLDGVDLDLEGWWGKVGNDQGGRLKSQGPHPAGYALTVFAERLRRSMPDKLVSAAVFATSWYGNNYDPKMVDHLDWVGVMTYDLTGSWNKSPVGPHTSLFKIRDQEAYAAEQQGPWPSGSLDNPIFSTEDSLWYWTNPFFVNWQGPGQQVSRAKLALGVPIYGYDFAYGKAEDSQTGYMSVRYKDILAQFPDAHLSATANIKVPGNTSRPPFISTAGTYHYAHNIYYETPGSAAAKLSFAKSQGMQGVIIWEVTNDAWDEGRSIIKSLYRISGDRKSGGSQYEVGCLTE
ncbi:glycosyl hydrolase family 18 protein [Corallococcus exercitus]|uniref:glycosyl hydrolase family 18 protein n=1 Tax=Corallococcus exercitus TaxID=2316736 RepID=UPI0035D43F7E